MSFDYKKVMEIAGRLQELGVPVGTIHDIRDWAEKKKASIQKGGKNGRT